MRFFAERDVDLVIQCGIDSEQIRPAFPAGLFEEALRHARHRARRQVGLRQGQHLRREAEIAAAAFDVTERFQRQQRTPHAGTREVCDARDVGQRQPVGLFAECLHDRQTARQRLDIVAVRGRRGFVISVVASSHGALAGSAAKAYSVR